MSYKVQRQLINCPPAKATPNGVAIPEGIVQARLQQGWSDDAARYTPSPAIWANGTARPGDAAVSLFEAAYDEFKLEPRAVINFIHNGDDTIGKIRRYKLEENKCCVDKCSTGWLDTTEIQHHCPAHRYSGTHYELSMLSEGVRGEMPGTCWVLPNIEDAAAKTHALAYGTTVLTDQIRNICGTKHCCRLAHLKVVGPFGESLGEPEYSQAQVEAEQRIEEMRNNGQLPWKATELYRFDGATASDVIRMAYAGDRNVNDVWNHSGGQAIYELLRGLR